MSSSDQMLTPPSTSGVLQTIPHPFWGPTAPTESPLRPGRQLQASLPLEPSGPWETRSRPTGEGGVPSNTQKILLKEIFSPISATVLASGSSYGQSANGWNTSSRPAPLHIPLWWPAAHYKKLEEIGTCLKLKVQQKVSVLPSFCNNKNNDSNSSSPPLLFL